MEQNNPYEAPSAKVFDVSAEAEGYDETGPFTPSGRFGRLSYFAWSTIFNTVITIATFAIAGGIGAMQGAGNSAAEIFLGGGSIGMIVMQVALLAVFILFTIRRLHDMNASGWWSVITVVPLVNFIAILVFLFKPGSVGANNYGPPRITRGWEKVLSYIVIGIFILGILAAIIIPMVTQ